jgi:hypothetical protein
MQLLLLLLLHHHLATKLCRTIGPEPSKQLIRNLCGVKDMGLADLEQSLQQRPPTMMAEIGTNKKVHV